MKSKILTCSKGIILDDLKRFSWIAFLYGYIIFLLIPLQIIINYKGKPLSNLPFDISVSILIISFLALLLPIIISILIFRYLHVQTASDLIHCLPIKRNELYRSHTFAGVMILITPVLVNVLICLILNLFVFDGSSSIIYNIMLGAISIISLSLVFYFISVCMGMIVGISLLQAVLTYAIVAFPLVITWLINYNLNGLIYGYIYDMRSITERVGFINQLINWGNDIYIMLGIVVFFSISITLYFLGQFLYKKRKLEAASEPISFKIMEYIFKYFITFFSMLIVGAIYVQKNNHSEIWVYGGYFVGATVGYFAVEMMLKKSFRVFSNVKGYVIYVLLTIIVLMGIKFDVSGYERKIPTVSNIKSINFNQDYIYEQFGYIYSKEVMSGMEHYTEKKAMETLMSFHKEIIDNKEKNIKNNKENSKEIWFVYELNDGTLIGRKYNIPMEEASKFIKTFHESEEYKKNLHDIMKIDTIDVTSITINSYGKKTIINNPEDIKAGLDMLRKDINNETYEQMEDKKAPWAIMYATLADDKIDKYKNTRNSIGNGRVFVIWRKSDILFEKWLTSKEYFQNSRIMPEDVVSVTVEKCGTKQKWDSQFTNNRYIEDSLKGVEIINKSEIEACLKNYKDLHKENQDKYIIKFSTNINNKSASFYGSFDETSVPEVIKSYFIIAK
ncbi:MAG: hypothetical protein H7Y18_00385 [Clostridiaceae bacterium]|nr:hypothetical protein [Clostridiaceae bacterium]